VDFEFGGTGFSDFFEQMFGSRRSGFSRGGGFANAPQRGSDIEADIMVSIEEAFHGSTRRISFRRGDSPQAQTYTVKIPKGVREGQRIRLAGQGSSGAGGGGAGDLYLRVKFQKHPDYEIEGSDLLRQVSVPVTTCVVGGTVELGTLEGVAKLRIPPLTQADKRFRLAGHGMPKPDGGRGDLYAIVEVELPTKLDEDEKALWEKLAAGR
jgi:curved DNA-binding protein